SEQIPPGAARGQDASDRVWPLCGDQPGTTRRQQAGDLQLLGLHAHLREDPAREVCGLAANDAQTHASEAEGHQDGTEAPPAYPTPDARAMAARGGHGTLSILWRAA